jgi:hypothetical protein
MKIIDIGGVKMVGVKEYHLYQREKERGKMDNQQEQIILLAQINTLKEMQIFCVKKELELKEQLSKLKAEETEGK